MKRLNKKYLEMALYLALALCISILFFLLIYHSSTALGVFKRLFRTVKPIVYGFLLAYIISPVIEWFESSMINLIFPKLTDPGKRRALAVTVSYALLITVMFAFFSVVLPQLAASVWGLLAKSQDYFKATVDFAVRMYDRIPFLDAPLTPDEITSLTDKALTRIGDWMGEQLPLVMGATVMAASSLFNVIVSTVISIYVVDSKERLKGQFKKLLYAFLPLKQVNRLIDIAHDADHIFGGFITGKLVDSLIIGLICYFGMGIMGMPEPTFISFVIGVTNVIPYFGPFIGGVPMAALMLFLDPSRALLFAVFIVLLQQFDGNILGPKILSDSVGISALWVVVSVTVFGELLGVFGMLFGVPLFALIHKVVSDTVRRRLDSKMLPVKTQTYEGEGFKLEETEIKA